MDYKELIDRLSAYSAEHQYHGGITAEAADALEALLAERDAAVAGLNRIAEFTETEFLREYDDKWRGQKKEETDNEID